MKRSVWKLPYIHPVFFKKRVFEKKGLKTNIRNSWISSSLRDKKIFVYNGIWYLSNVIIDNMVGMKLGEFSYTRKLSLRLHIKKKKKRKK